LDHVKRWLTGKIINDTQPNRFMGIVVLSGGTGSIKLVRALYRLKRDISIVCNVGDNIWLHGLYICPDIDTVVYGLAGILDARGWGLKNDTFNCLDQLSLLGEERWFMLGDKDIALHIVRSKLMREGKSLSEVTDYICRRLGIDTQTRIIPVSDEHMETRILTPQGRMHLQEFWVKHRGMLDVKDIEYVGNARASSKALDAIMKSSKIIIPPANPVSSIGSILAIQGIRDALKSKRDSCIAISPIVGDGAVSGPAGKYMLALGYEPNVYSLSFMYRDFISSLVIDVKDMKYKESIEGLGIRVHIKDILLDDASALELARYLIEEV